MLNSFRLDFSGQVLAVKDKVQEVGQLIRNQVNLRDLVNFTNYDQ